MIKADIVKKVAQSLKMKDKEALVIVDATLEAMKQIVAEQGRLEIRDFGVFQVKNRKQRIGRNPKDKKEYPIPPRRVVTFKMGKELKISGEATGTTPGDSSSAHPTNTTSTGEISAPPATQS
jgi:nucleoid DNA-binding protein